MTRLTTLALVCALAAGCATNGIFSLKARDNGPEMLHEVYAVMTENGYLMKRPRSTETYSEETWHELDQKTAGTFVDPAYPKLIASVMYSPGKREFYMYFDESPVGFSPQGAARTDKAVRALKQRFGKNLRVYERRNYRGKE